MTQIGAPGRIVNLETWHWSVQVTHWGRCCIEESGDATSETGAWIRVGETIRRRGDDIAALAIDPDITSRGTVPDVPIQLYISVIRVSRRPADAPRDDCQSAEAGLAEHIEERMSTDFPGQPFGPGDTITWKDNPT
jgi:hypothetical protein